ncbi:unnamed protein product, partial [Vitis vinifera]
MSSSSSSLPLNFVNSSSSSKLPLRSIPGDCGSPFFGPIKDRFDYFYNEGRDQFFRTRMQKYQSTVFRANMPPGPFMAFNPNVVVLLDAISFPILFDTSRIEKRNVLDGTYMPSTAFTGGYRVCAYLDPSEPNHALLKRFFTSSLAARHHNFIPVFRSCLTELFTTLEDDKIYFYTPFPYPHYSSQTVLHCIIVSQLSPSISPTFLEFGFLLLHTNTFTYNPIMSSSSDKNDLNSSSSLSKLPLRKIPGDYGLPFFGAIKDRLDYFYKQGREEFFNARMHKYQSTVFRANMPPGPFMASNPNVIVLLDSISFPILFDTSKVEKRNVLDGTYMPSTAFTGGYRVCAYLDPSETNHALLKRLFMSALAARHHNFIPLFQTALGSQGPSIVTKWLFFQLAPLITLGLSLLPNFVEDLLLHTFPLPSIFALFPSLIKWVGSAGEKLHRELADEIRTVVKAEGGVSFAALEKMSLTKSVVYEALRIDPPVPFQYGKAKEDMVIHSHDAAFEIKKGEMIFGYQPFATKDPKVFDNPEEFMGNRFMGEGERLLKYVYWSNGRESGNPTVENKQCAGKDLVLLLSRVMLVEFFLRYDTFDIESGTLLLGSSVTFKSITKATDS